MDDSIISVEHLSKRYRLGQIGATTLRESVERWWHRLRGRDPGEHMGVVGAGRRATVAKLSGRQVAKLPSDSSLSNSTTQQPGNPRTSSSATQQLDNPTTDSNDLWALRDVSFEVKRGEVLGIVGRNGAGKSTLLKILSRITEPTAGRAVLRGRLASLLEVGTGFHPELTGRENIFLNGAILGMKRREIAARFDEIVAFSEVERFIDTPVKRYSSGMYVRLAFAVAAHLDPEILLVDEVLAVGDAAFQKKCLGKMSAVAGQGRTVLFVSHNMVAVQSLCGKGIWLEAGAIRQTGSAATVTSDYLRAGQETALSRRWDSPADAPGDDLCRMRSIKITLPDGSQPAELTMAMPFRIETVYTIARARTPVHLTFHIVNEQGIVAFTTTNGYVLQGRGMGSAAGVYRNVCHVPGNLLNSGVYFVKVLLVRDWAKVFYANDSLLSFEIVDSTARAEGWQGRELGIVQPRLAWDVEHSAEAT